MSTEIAPLRHTIDVDPWALGALRDTLEGQLFSPDDIGYDEARTPWSLHVTQRPVLVAMAASAADVVAAVTFADAQRLPVAVQGTGHGTVAAADGALLINTARMQGIQINPMARVARVEAGVKWGPVLEAAQAFGLAPLLGSSPDVGVVGYTLGGGLGWLARKYGLAVDSVRAFDIVTADGRLHSVTAENDPELFWGVRGSESNFGIVTSIEFELFPVQQVYAGNIFFPIAMAREVMRAYAAWVATLPDEWTTSVVLMHMPPDPLVPEPLRGQSFVIVRGCFVGEASAAEETLRPIRALGGIIIDAFGPMSFRDAASISNDPIDPMNYHGRTEVLKSLSSEAIDRLIELAGEPPTSPLVFAEVRHAGGATSRGTVMGSAFGHRDMEFILFVTAYAPGEEARLNSYIEGVGVALRPVLTGQIYLNFMLDTDYTPERVRAGYTPEVYQRLVTLKKRYDPRNRFRFNRNIVPSAQ